MYHNGEDISAYLDGELPEDAARDVERRLETDIAAREELERLRGLRETLQEVQDDPDVEESRDRVWARLEERLGFHQPLWRRRISIPVPAVAAAAVAVLALAGLLVWGLGPTLAGDLGLTANPTEAEARVAVSGMEGEELLGWLQDSELATEVSVQLPETARFRINGEPRLMRASELRGRSESQDR